MKRTLPAVFTVEDRYEILIPTETPSLMWIEVGGEVFCDEINGVMRSSVEVHRIELPKAILDREKNYTVVERVIIERGPYFPTSDAEQRTAYSFRPCNKPTLRAFCM